MSSILIVEDDQILLQMYKDKFQIGKFEVLTALDGEEGLHLALDRHPDLILLDLAMPRMDGMTVMRKLREDPWGKTAPVIILTNLNIDGVILDEIIKNKPTYTLMKANTTPDDVLARAKEVIANQVKQ
ncbi:MAG TPA: response regulator [Patescibacteria group bacterium]